MPPNPSPSRKQEQESPRVEESIRAEWPMPPSISPASLREYAKTIERIPAGSKKQANHYTETARGLRTFAAWLEKPNAT